MNKEKLSFFKKVRISIFDFDGYQELAAQKVSRTIAYIVLLILIFSIVISLTYMYQFSILIGRARDYVTNEISEIKYENYNLQVITNDGEKITEIDTNDILEAKVIINTESQDEEKINECIDKIESSPIGILILKDRVILKNEFSTNLIEYSYKTISEQYNIDKIDKQEVLNMLSGQSMTIILLMFFVIILLYMFIIYISSVLIDILLLAILAYIASRFSGLRLRYSALYNIASYSLTLPIILNIIYVVVNRLTGFTIEYFQIMYTAVATIYIITAILMIKSDVIKKQMELRRIIEEQEKVKQELKQKEEEEKEKREEERRRKQREEKEKEKNENDGEIGNTPEGDNA